jgi:hypothetical protein
VFELTSAGQRNFTCAQQEEGEEGSAMGEEMQDEQEEELDNYGNEMADQ